MKKKPDTASTGPNGNCNCEQSLAEKKVNFHENSPPDVEESKMSGDISLLISAKEAAAILSVSLNIVYQLCRSHNSGFPSFRVGSKYLVSKTGLEQWIAERLACKSEVEL